eukprot:INCI17515.1.p1 GENE.INCI17515.1~~INCI17515.1.p1  ORF type:complete len:716 (+),score=149.89 INCI17515.1:626-2773(+)
MATEPTTSDSRAGFARTALQKNYVRPRSTRHSHASRGGFSGNKIGHTSELRPTPGDSSATVSRSGVDAGDENDDDFEDENEEETPAEVAELLHLLRLHGRKPTTVEDIQSMPEAVKEISDLRKLVRHVYMELQCKTLKLVPSPAHGHNRRHSGAAGSHARRSSMQPPRARAWTSDGGSGGNPPSTATATSSNSAPNSALKVPRTRSRSVQLQFPLKGLDVDSSPDSSSAGTPTIGTLNPLSQSLPNRGFSTPAVMSRSAPPPRSASDGNGNSNAMTPGAAAEAAAAAAAAAAGGTSSAAKRPGARSASKNPALAIKTPDKKAGGHGTPSKSPGLNAGDSTPGIASALAAFQATMRKKNEFSPEEAAEASKNIAAALDVLSSVDPEKWSRQFDAIDQLRAIIIHRPNTLNTTWGEATGSPRPNSEADDNVDAREAAAGGGSAGSSNSSDDGILVEDETLLDSPGASRSAFLPPPPDQPLVGHLCTLIRRLSVNLRTALARNGLAAIANMFEFTEAAMVGEVAETVPFLVRLAGTTDKKFIRTCAREAVKQAIKSKANLAEAVALACLDPDVTQSKSASVVNEAATWLQSAVDAAHNAKALDSWKARDLAPGICRLFSGKGSKGRSVVRAASQKFTELHGDKFAAWLEEAGMAKHDVAKMVARPKSRASARDQLKAWKRQQKQQAAAAGGSAGTKKDAALVDVAVAVPKKPASGAST